jgi:hypothetical protein
VLAEFAGLVAVLEEDGAVGAANQLQVGALRHGVERYDGRFNRADRVESNQHHVAGIVDVVLFIYGGQEPPAGVGQAGCQLSMRHGWLRAHLRA